ncbi:uncharacterized protein LOC133193567 [Saccostrea echinata]|uniref:uncharacterized protein LOC133193567 n=1 Tax=Saccostrea echinata TaxID=191078 RepID=UPI002A7F3CEB|nr:uncharacterized protein LOC133193567 [Saccostrea echinata]
MPAEISDLPNEVLLLIFSYLSFYDIVHSIRVVCSRWRDLGKKKCLWNRIGVMKWMKEALNHDDFLHRARVIGRNLDTLSFSTIQEEEQFNWTLVTDMEHFYSIKYGRSHEVENENDVEDEVEDDDSKRFNGLLLFLREDLRCPNVKAIHAVESDISLCNFLQLLEKYSQVKEVVIDQNACFDLQNPEKYMPALQNLVKLNNLTVKCDERDDTQIEEEGIWRSQIWNTELEKLVRAHPDLTYLDVSLPGSCEHLIETIMKNCQKLKTLKMTGDKRQELDLNIMPNAALPLVEELSLYDFNLEPHDFKSILTVACAGKKLQKLNLIDCYDITEDIYQIVSENCPLLRRFVGKEDEHYVKVKNRIYLLQRTMEYTFINDNALTYLSACKYIQELSIADSSGKAVTDEGIRTLARGCTQLKNLNLEDCDLGVMEVARYCRELRVVNLNKCLHTTGFGFSCLVINCQGLQHVEMSGCNSFKKVILSKEQRFPAIPLASLNQSIHVETKPAEIQCNCSTFSESSRICPKIIRSQREIKALYGITEDNIPQTSIQNNEDESAALVCSPPKPFRVSSDHSWIQMLDLSYCKSVCDSDIIEICKYCPEIRSLIVASNENLTDTSILAVSRYLTLLTTLEIQGIGRLTNDSLTALAKSDLVNLSLQACPRMTINGLEKILTTNKTLKKMQICQNEEVDAVAFRSNNIKKLLVRISTDNVVFEMTNNMYTDWFNIEARRKS